MWKRMIARLIHEDMSTWSMINNYGRYSCDDGVHYVWQCTAQEIYGKKVENKKDFIARLLTECSGIECGFDVKYTAAGDQKNDAVKENQLLNEITSTFGAANVIVQ